MTTYTTIPDADIDQDSPVTQPLMTALRDNPIAIAEGGTNAPRVATKNSFNAATTGLASYGGARLFIVQRNTSGVGSATLTVNVTDSAGAGTAQNLLVTGLNATDIVHGYWTKATGVVRVVGCSLSGTLIDASATVTKTTSDIHTLTFATSGGSGSFEVHVMPDGGESAT